MHESVVFQWEACSITYVYVAVTCVSEDIGGPLINLESSLDISTISVFGDYKFGRTGKVTAWLFWAKSPGHITCLVLRRTSYGKYRVIGQNDVWISRSGLVRYDVAESERISVQATDCIGYFKYASSSGDIGTTDSCCNLETWRKSTIWSTASTTSTVGTTYKVDIAPNMSAIALRAVFKSGV